MGFAAAILAMVLLFAGCGQTETKTESSGTKSTGSESTVSENTQTESSTAASETEDETPVHVLALKGPTSMGMVKMMSDNDSKESPADTFELAAAPDEVSAKLVQGEVDIAAVPANLASVLYNKTNGGVQVLAVNTLGVLYIVEDGDTVHSIADLKGRTIYAVRSVSFFVCAVVTNGCGSMAIPSASSASAATHSACSLFHSIVTSSPGTRPFFSRI